MVRIAAVKRLLLCPPLYAPSRGGSQDLFSDLAVLWRAGGGKAVVYTCATESGAQVSADRAPVTVRRFPARWAATARWRGHVLAAVSRLGPRPWQAAVGFPHLLTRGYRGHLRHRAQTEDGPFDLLIAGVLPHTHFLDPAVRFARRHGIPWVAVPLLHTGLLGHRPLRQVAGPGAAALLTQADRVIALTAAEVPALCRLGIQADRIVVLPAALMARDTPGAGPGRRAPSGKRTPCILQAGALAADKGTLDLIAAHAARVGRGAVEHLVLAGRAQPEVLGALRRLPESVRHKIDLQAEPDDPAWHDTLAGASLLVQPSRADSFGRVILEAWRAGCPVLVAASGGLPHLVRDGEDGRVIPAGDVQALAAAMDDMLADREATARLGANGRARFLTAFTWEKVYPAWRRVFDLAMSRQIGESAA
jgi:glycosyltransferase involved in cell wall biosynthesis